MSGNVEMVNTGNVTRTYQYQIEGMVRFGKELKITPKANATINKPGYKTEFFVPTVSVVVGIGNNHCADIVMSVDAWEALKAGEKVVITTTEEFKKKYVHKK